MMNSRVWVISGLYAPEDVSTGHFITGIAEGLASRYDVRVLCGQPSYGLPGKAAPRRETLNGVRVTRHWAPGWEKTFLPLRLINAFVLCIAILAGALRGIRTNDCVLVVTNPPLLPFLLALVCWLRSARLLVLIHDVFPDILVASGLLKPDSMWVKLLQVGNKELLRRASRIVVLGRDMHRMVVGVDPALRSKVEIITNWGDVTDVFPGIPRENGLLHDEGLGNKFVVQYSGNLGRTHDLESLLEAARRLREFAGVHILLIGSGAKKRIVLEAMARERLKNVSFLPYVHRSRLCESLNACHVAVIAFIPGMSGLSVPSRMYNVMAAGKAIIAVADLDSELGQVVRDEGIGWVVEPSNRNELAKVILEAQSDPVRLKEMGDRARRVVTEKYTRAKVVERFAEIVGQLTHKASARLQ